MHVPVLTRHKHTHTQGTQTIISSSLKQPGFFISFYCFFFPKSSQLWGHYSEIHTSIWEQGDIIYRCTALRSHLCVKGRCVCAVNKRGESESAEEPCQEIFPGCQGAVMLDFMKKYVQ